MVVGAQKSYGGGLTSGALLVRESRIVARLLAAGEKPDSVKATVMDGNLLQNNSSTTTRKYCQLIISRLQQLNSAQIQIVAEGSDESAALLLMAAALKTYPIVRDFVTDVVFDKVRCYEPNLDKKDWTRFLEQRETIDPNIKKWTESSRKKIGQVIFRMLSEAGLLSDTRRMLIQFPSIPCEVADSLLQSSDGRTLECLKLGKGA